MKQSKTIHKGSLSVKDGRIFITTKQFVGESGGNEIFKQVTYPVADSTEILFTIEDTLLGKTAHIIDVRVPHKLKDIDFCPERFAKGNYHSMYLHGAKITFIEKVAKTYEYSEMIGMDKDGDVFKTNYMGVCPISGVVIKMKILDFEL